MTIRRLENIGIVVEDLKAAVDFFQQLGLTLLGEATVEGDWVDRVVGLDQVRSEIAMLQTADGHGRLELMRFARPTAHPGEGAAPANTLGIRRIAFAVDDIDASVAGLTARGIALVGDVVTFQDAYRLCYVRGPEGIIVMLSEELVDPASGDRASDAPPPD
ncbi:VOC family protein [Demequina muriae]|uniref:VOC family protein n=1 Tax=Demequina muriae TaxID=3051664 RepID=A0ABT8GDZ4_9MICO|nr:VOC family protein [Demequina sp. EGI L300058]MDN4479494.1 VOC family protein [Demequina sp. EGI L300058]